MNINIIPSRPANKLIYPVTPMASPDRWFWGKWLLCIMIVFAVYWSIMDVAPFLHADEFIILDLGRVILHPDTDWSIAWMMNRDQPVLAWFYVGPVFQELSFQLVGQYGPRLLSLIGAFACATTVVGWLLSKGTVKHAALVLGLVFLLDPLLVQAYSLGRLDGWTMAFCIASCWILSDTTHQAAQGRVSRWRIMLAGVLATIAFFIWPSAVFLLPLILLELAVLAKAYYNVHPSRKMGMIPWLLFAAGGLVSAGLLILPIASQLSDQFDNMAESVAINTRTGPSGSKSFLLHSFSQFVELFRVFKFSPVVLLSGILMAIWLRKVGLLLAALAAVALMVGTLVYIQRVQYLLPYLIASIAGMYQLSHQKKHLGTSTLRFAAIALPFIWCVGLSLISRTILALDKAEERNRDIVFDAGQTLIGQGEYRVFVPHEFYYTARALGWKMYWPYMAQKERVTPEVLQRILPRVDYVIAEPPSKVAKELYQVMQNEGLTPSNSYYRYEAGGRGNEGKTTNIKRLRILYSIYRTPYGPYQLYVREPHRTIAIKH